MRSRFPAAAAVFFAIGFALFAVGCEKTPPPPTVDNTNVEATASVTATLGIEAMITVEELAEKAEEQGLSVAMAPTKKSGVFLPAEYSPMRMDEALVQVYRFKNPREANWAAATVDMDGFVLDAAPDRPVTVNWTGWPAFFRSGDLIVIFVTEKGKGAHIKRDKRVFEALKIILGEPFTGGQSSPESLSAVSASSSVVSTATTAGAGASRETTK